jgi:hypothetical protein
MTVIRERAIEGRGNSLTLVKSGGQDVMPIQSPKLFPVMIIGRSADRQLSSAVV